MERLLHFKDIGLIPKLSQLKSRADADTSISFLEYQFKLPVVPSNMVTVINFELAEQLAKAGYFYILHRFYDYNAILGWVVKNQDKFLISISIGVKEEDSELVETLGRKGCQVHFLTIDVSHGFSEKVRLMIKHVKRHLPYTKIIAGNVWGDFASINFLEEAGADCIKVGLSFGSGCTTYNKTAFCSPMFSCGLGASKNTKLPLISDGGCQNNGDVAKVLRAGYSMAMIGGLFAACIDSPAKFVNGKKHYFGSASSQNKGHNKHVEGREVLLDCNNMTYMEKMEEIQQDLSSAISYSGGSSLNSLKNVDWFRL